MTISITHKFVSNKSDGTDATIVQPSNWNDTHQIQLDSLTLMGRISTLYGNVEQVPVTAYGIQVINKADAAATRTYLGAVNIAGDTMTGALILPANGLNVGSGQLQVTGGNVTCTGNFTAQGDVTGLSDERLKMDMHPIKDALKIISQLQGIRYTMRSSGQVSIGVSAQNTAKALPEVVRYDDQGIASVAYGNMAGLFIEAINALVARIEHLEATRTEPVEKL
jgi:hypothetical protein